MLSGKYIPSEMVEISADARKLPADADLNRSEALSDIYRRYSAWLTAMLRIRGAGEACEDVVQETYLRAARYPAEALVKAPQALLLKVAQNIIRDAARRDRYAKAYSAEALSSVETWASPKNADQFESLLFEQILSLMPKLQREVFVLRRIRGLTNEEVAETLSISLKSVERRMTEALKFCSARMRD